MLKVVYKEKGPPFNLHRGPPFPKATTVENLRNVEMATAISLQDYQVTKNMFWDHGLSQGDATNDKYVTKSLWFLQFQFLLEFFACNSN